MRLKNFCFCCVLILSATHLLSIDIGNEFNVSGRYRRDEINSTDKINFLPSTTGEKGKIKAKNLDVWQWGIDARFVMPTEFCGVFSFLNNFYLDGFVYSGYGGDGGNLRNDIQEPSTGENFVGKGKLTNAQAYDYQVGIGYLFDWETWGIGLSGGYSYDKFEIKTKHNTIFSPLARKYRATNIWEGAWVGAELFYNICAWKFILGYEYHFPTYTFKNATSSISILPADLISLKAHQKQAQGKVVFLNAHYYLCEGLVIGAGIKYQYWNVNHAKLRPRTGTFLAHGLPATTKAKKDLNWISYSAILDIGYYF